MPNLYNPDRQVYFEEHKKHYLKDEQKKHELDDLQLEQHALSIQLPAPKSLLDIVEFGINHPSSAVCAVAELLE